jgi:AraC-like DNA-binding protein
MSNRYAVFQTATRNYYPDTCVGLREASSKQEVELKAYIHGDYPGTPFPEGVLLGVQSVGYWNSLQEQKWGLPWHRNEGIELTFLENGHMDFSVGNNKFILEPNALTITRPWQPHKVGNPNIGPCKLHWIILDVGVRRPHQEWLWPDWLQLTKREEKHLTILLSHHEEPVWPLMKSMRPVFQEIGHIITEQSSLDSFTLLKLKLNELFYRLLIELRQIEPPLTKRLTSTMRNVELFLEDLEREPERPWTIEGMARECGLGKTVFMENFKRITNMTPTHYLNYLRVKKSKKLLESRSEFSVLDIAMECGFSSSQYFASIFKRFTGMTPSDIRKNGKGPAACRIR